MREIDFNTLSFLTIDRKSNKFFYLSLFSKRFDEELNITFIFLDLPDFLFDMCLCLTDRYSFDVVQEKMLVELRDVVIGPSVDEFWLQFDVHCL